MNLNANVTNVLRLIGVLCILFALAVQLDWIASKIEPVLALIIGVVFLLVSGVL